MVPPEAPPPNTRSGVVVPTGPTLVQAAYNSGTNNALPALASPPTPGNVMVCAASARDVGIGGVAGWTTVGGSGFQASAGVAQGILLYRVVQAGDTTTPCNVSSPSHYPSAYLMEFACPQGKATVNANRLTGQGATTSPTIPITLTSIAPWLEVFVIVSGVDGAGNNDVTALGAGWTEVYKSGAGGGFAPGWAAGWADRSSSLSGNATTANQSWGGAIVAFSA